MEIRAAADLETVLALRLAFLGELRGVDPTDFDPAFVDVTRRYLEDATAADRIRSWLAFDGGIPIGIVSVLANDSPPLPEEHRAKEGYVVNLWVAPTARRRGIARTLLRAAKAAARDEGWRRLYLHATDEGRPLYEDEGFAPDARWMGTRIEALGE